MTLDQLLEVSREPEPFDSAFTASVMNEVHTHEQRRWRMRIVHRPVVATVAAVVLATSGAVAALVGTHPSPKTSVSAPTPGRASVAVSALPSHGAAALPSTSSVVASPRESAAAIADGRAGVPSLHTAWIIDEATGLKLTTETYTNRFAVDKAQKVTLTILNTSSNALVLNGLSKCALDVVATPAGGTAGPGVCASSGVSNDQAVLAPGGFYTATAMVKLPTSGTWTIVGHCDCSYADASSVITKKDSPFGAVLQKAAPPAIVPGKANPTSGVARLSTPAIGVKAS